MLKVHDICAMPEVGKIKPYGSTHWQPWLSGVGRSARPTDPYLSRNSNHPKTSGRQFKLDLVS